MPTVEAMQLIDKYGYPIAVGIICLLFMISLVVIFMRRDEKRMTEALRREDALGKRIENVERVALEAKDETIQLSQNVLRQNTDALTHFSRACENCIKIHQDLQLRLLELNGK